MSDTIPGATCPAAVSAEVWAGRWQRGSESVLLLTAGGGAAALMSNLEWEFELLQQRVQQKC